jgi:hypothetical protein
VWQWFAKCSYELFKSRINPINYPHPVYSHSTTWKYVLKKANMVYRTTILVCMYVYTRVGQRLALAPRPLMIYCASPNHYTLSETPLRARHIFNTESWAGEVLCAQQDLPYGDPGDHLMLKTDTSKILRWRNDLRHYLMVTNSRRCLKLNLRFSWLYCEE